MKDVLKFGFAHEDQIKLVHSCQDTLFKAQITLIESVVDCDPNCLDLTFKKHGKRLPDYHDILRIIKLRSLESAVLCRFRSINVGAWVANGANPSHDCQGVAEGYFYLHFNAKTKRSLGIIQ
jgi:hypothetical protein